MEVSKKSRCVKVNCPFRDRMKVDGNYRGQEKIGGKKIQCSFFFSSGFQEEIKRNIE